MRSTPRILASAVAALLLFPSVVAAQEVIVDPPIRCADDCWWPVGSVAQLDTMDADIDVTDGTTVARYRFELSNPNGQGGPGAEGRIVFPVPEGSSVTDLLLSGGPETLEGRHARRRRCGPHLRRHRAAPHRPSTAPLARWRSLRSARLPVPAGEQREVSFTVTTPLLAEGEQATVEVPWSRMSPRPSGAAINVDVDVPWELRSASGAGL